MLALKRIVVDGYKAPLPFNDVIYGTAFHRFVSQMYVTKGDFASCISQAQEIIRKPSTIRKKHLTEKHLIKTCLDYWEQFRATDDFEILEVNGKPMVEVTFEVPIYEDEDVIILLVGTIDKVGKFKNGCYGIGDYKTSSTWDLRNYFDQYRISTQLTTYYYGAETLARNFPDSPLARIFQTKVGVFIDGIFVGSQGTEFKRSEIMFLDDKMVDTYAVLLQKKCIALAAAVKQEPMMEGIIQGSCTEQQFKCDFFNVCAAPDDIARGHLLKRDFVQKYYDPFKFNE